MVKCEKGKNWTFADKFIEEVFTQANTTVPSLWKKEIQVIQEEDGKRIFWKRLIYNRCNLEPGQPRAGSDPGVQFISGLSARTNRLKVDTVNHLNGRMDCQLQSDLDLFLKVWFVQSTNNDASEKDKNVSNIARPRAPSRPPWTGNLYRLPPVSSALHTVLNIQLSWWCYLFREARPYMDITLICTQNSVSTVAVGPKFGVVWTITFLLGAGRGFSNFSCWGCFFFPRRDILILSID